MIGFQKQLTEFQPDSTPTWWSTRATATDSQRDPNLFYERGHGPADEPEPRWAVPNPAVRLDSPEREPGAIELHGARDVAEAALHEELSSSGVTYTLMFYKHDTGIGSAGFGAMQLNNFNIDDGLGHIEGLPAQHACARTACGRCLKGFASFSAYLRLRIGESVVHDQHQRRSAELSGTTRIRNDLSDYSAQQLLQATRSRRSTSHVSKDVRSRRTHQGRPASPRCSTSATTHSSPTTRLKTSSAFGDAKRTANAPRIGQLALQDVVLSGR